MGVPYISIHPTRITSYWVPDQRVSGVHRPTLTGAQVKERHNGLISAAQKKRLYEAITALVAISQYKTVYSQEEQKSYRFKLNFITLTLPDSCEVEDKIIVKKCLKRFLDAWNKRSPSLLYVWKAECTDRGTLHFHLTTNQFIHYHKLRTKWNKALAKEGIISKADVEKNNSTDVHSVKKIRNIAAYLTAYVCKKDVYSKPLKRWFKLYGKELSNQNRKEVLLPRNYFARLKRKPECSLWSASKALLRTKLNGCYSGTEIERELETTQEWIDRAVTSEYFTTSFIKTEEWLKSKHIRLEWNRWMTERIRADKGYQDIYRKVI